MGVQLVFEGSMFGMLFMPWHLWNARESAPICA